MGQKLPPNENELYKRTDEVLHYIWDPIGVAGAPEARDEYYSYLPGVFRLVMENAGAEKIAEYLIQIAQAQMGLRPDKNKAMETAEILIHWKKKIFN